MPNVLNKIRARAKQIMKKHPSKHWKNAMVEAGKDYRAGKLRSSRPKRRKAAKRKPAKRRRVSVVRVKTVSRIYKPKRKRRMKTSRKTRRRHHRVGALALAPASPLVKFGSIAAGYFLLGDKINDAIAKATGDKVSGKVVGAAEGGLGFLLMTKGKKTVIKTALGGLLVGAGLKKLLKEFGVITGYGGVPVVGNRVNGYGRVPVVGSPAGYSQQGYTPSIQLAGALNGYNVPPVPPSIIGSFADDGTDGSGSGINSDSR